MTIDVQHLNTILRPAAPPQVVQDLYTQDQYERMLGVLKSHGPWPTIGAHHFNTVEELVATSNGGSAERVAFTLDDIASAHFRGFFAENSVSYYPELHDCFYNERFLGMAKDYWGGAQYARPTMMLFNFCGPHNSGLNSHIDAVTFRGIRIENSPVWLQNVMGRSGLFTDHLVKMAQVITWWYLGENGTFTYWPDGPLGDPQRLEHPLWNKGVVVQNEAMFHRGDPVGHPDERDIAGLKHRSLIAYEEERDTWAVTTDDQVIRRYRPQEMRLLVHWNAEVYTDLDEVKKNMDHSDDLTHDRVFERLLADMRARGVTVAEPSDPLHDQEFIRALIATYSITPVKDWARPAA